MRFCECRAPERPADPRRHKSCAACGKLIDWEADWIVNDRTHGEFLERVEQTLAAVPGEGWPADEPPPDWCYFRRLALERERAGRERFGLEYLGRDNIKAGIEENSDSINYDYMEHLQALHDGNDEEWDLVLTIAYHDFMSYRNRLRLRERRRGSP